MITDIDKYIDFLCKHRISEHQFLILWLVHTKDTENIKKYKLSGKEFNPLDLEYLVDCGFLLDVRGPDERTWDIFKLIVTDKFSKVVVIDEEDAYEELCSVYPRWIEVKGIRYPTIKGDPRVVAKDYHRAYKGNRLAHERIMSITQRYYKNHNVTGNIHDYILNRRWNLLEEELGKGSSSEIYKTL